jgi:ElaB/YqjD/DUF883 family membrane-anchored ribosome-binding protein
MNTNLKTDELVTDLKRIVHDSEELLQATKDTLGENGRDTRKRIKHAMDRAKRTCRRLEARAIHRAKAADRVIRSHPYQSLGIALGAGLLLGGLMGKKSTWK